MPEENIHKGHRERIRQRYIKDGLDNFHPHQVLEFLLFFAITRRDTNELAHLLLERFGTISGVFDAEIEDLKSVKGMSENAAVLMSLFPAVARYYLCDKGRGTTVLKSTKEIAEFVQPQFVGKRTEMLYLICLNGKNEILFADFISQGTINAVALDTRLIVDKALRCNATGIILAHNHPDSLALPSKEDLIFTIKLMETLKPIKIRVLDHFVVRDMDSTSMRENGYFNGLV